MPRRKLVPPPRGPSDVMPLFATTIMDQVQLILPRDRLVVYYSNSET